MTEQNRTVHVKVFPDAKKERVLEVQPWTFEIYVREPAQHNLANSRVRECVAEHFNVPLTHVTIETGHRARKKRLTVQMPDVIT